MNLTLDLGRNTSDPDFEEQVFNEMDSAGSQIGRMAALLEVLLNASRGKAALKYPDARAGSTRSKKCKPLFKRRKRNAPRSVRSSSSWTRCKQAIPRDTNGLVAAIARSLARF